MRSRSATRSSAPHLLVAGIVLSTALTACTDTSSRPVRLAFAAHSAHLENCGAGAGVLRFYVSGLRAIDEGGERVPIELAPAGPWQGGDTALVSLAGDCGAAEGWPNNAAVTGRVPPGAYRHLEFDLGVPVEHNHANPLRARPPLDSPSMFWTWQSGYKFVRFDLGGQWSFHLGSTGCVSASAARAPPDGCRQPNRARVRLPLPATLDVTAIVDLDALLAGVDMAGQPPCTGRYAERASCAGLLTALGLDPVTGECVDGCAAQRVFRLDAGTR